ncbi:MAG TPA: branched-chain amino acid ABC transporter permease/ATP-binding protein [Acidimicrobiia bacterium]|jgi:ABC-type branched-subunit amino acid transport system ATPase component/ABC-type branched-subunit amino acid transport system permease subunit
MLASLFQPHIWTANLLFEGFVNGLSIALTAMGIVLIYRSSRVINFAVGDLGVPAAALLAVMVGKSHWPYWPALIFAVLVGTLSGTVVELAVIRRLFKAPRVIVLVATIGVAELARAITLTLPDYRTGQLQTTYPSPMSSTWNISSIQVSGPQLLVVIIVPIVTVGLWWLLNRTTFGESVRATATNADLARLTGINPKLMSTAIWTIAGFLSAVSVILIATQQTSTELVSIGPDTLLLGLAAALIGRMTSFPRAAIGAIVLSILDQVLVFNFPNETGLVEFVLFLVVLVLVAQMARVDDAGGESFAFAPRVPPVPERLREVWWVRRLPQIVAGIALVVAIIIPLVIKESARHQTYAMILALAICAVSVTVLTGWAGQLSLGQMAFAGVGALGAAAFARGLSLNMGWHANRVVKGSLRPMPLLGGFLLLIIAVMSINRLLALRRNAGSSRRLFDSPGLLALVSFLAIAGGATAFVACVDRSATPHPLPFVISLLLGAAIACVIAVGVGLGALRVRGLLLAISTMAFAIAAENYLFSRPFFAQTEGSLTVEFPRGKLGPIDLTHLNRNYYYFVLAALVLVLILVGHLRRTGIGRSIIGVRENEPAASALTVSPARAKLTAFAMGGFIAGLGGALLGGLVITIGYSERFFTFPDSLTLVSLAVIGGLGSLAGAVTGALWVIGLPAFWPTNQTVPLFTSSIGLLIILLYIPGGFTQIAYWIRGLLLNWVEKRLPDRPTKTATAPPSSLARAVRELPPVEDGVGALSTSGLTVRFGGLLAVDSVDFRAEPGEVIGLIGTNGAGKSTLLNAIGGYVQSSGSVRLFGDEVSGLPAHMRARKGLGRTFQAATLFPELTVRECVQLALEARKPTSFWGSLLYVPSATRAERVKRSESAELIDYLGLGRYADRFIAELSTGTRRIVELASVLAVAPRVICLDEPTAGVAQREAEAFGPLIKRVQQELDATLIVVEHDLPMILSISDRIYCMEAGAVIASGTPNEIRADEAVVASYLGTDTRAIQRSNA